MGFKRVLKCVAVASLLGAMLGGCVVRPLWWDGHGHYERDHGGPGYGPGYGGGYYRH